MFSWRTQYTWEKSTLEVSHVQLGGARTVSVWCPKSKWLWDRFRKMPVLLVHDGQEIESLKALETAASLLSSGQISPFILVSVPTKDRMQEYGIQGRPDYKQRGSKAIAFGDMIEDLMHLLIKNYPVDTSHGVHGTAGFSLSALAAVDLVWHHSEWFGWAGCFSGSFWWRSQAMEEAAPDANRIVIELIEQSLTVPKARWWLQTGTLDETDDRNNNGIIDSIDDTLAVKAALEQRGIKDITYVEVKGGEHNYPTWSRVFDDFLFWAFGK